MTAHIAQTNHPNAHRLLQLIQSDGDDSSASKSETGASATGDSGATGSASASSASVLTAGLPSSATSDSNLLDAYSQAVIHVVETVGLCHHRRHAPAQRA